jgi:hypothetical protein
MIEMQGLMALPFHRTPQSGLTGNGRFAKQVRHAAVLHAEPERCPMRPTH